MNNPENPPASDRAPVSGLLTAQISNLSKLYNRQLARYLHTEHDISPAEWWILGYLGEESPRTLRVLAEETLLDKGQLSRAAGTLDGKGYITKEQDPADARSVLFHITDKGREVQQVIMRARRALNQDLNNLLEPGEREALESALVKLRAFFSQED